MNHVRARSILCLVVMSVSALAMAQSAPLPPEAPGYVSLTAKQRSHRFFREYLGSPFTYIAAAGAASGGQIGNDPKEWTRSWEGYGRRVGTTFALFTIDTGVHEAGDAMLGLDPRYFRFRCRCRGGLKRTWNAVEMSFLAYDSKGRKRLDLPQLAGAYGSGMIVTTWYPKGYDPLVQGVQMGHQQLGFVVSVNLIREFSPELKQFFGHFKPR
jgi:hypothetical protein